jgi:RNA recognition motif-containing protein
MSLTKLFIGNLSFKTKESELSDEFGAFGKVATANIITRGNRSLGYGFVEFENEQDAQNALQALNKKSINGREINVELATPRQEGATKSPQPRRGNFRGGFRGGRGGRGGSPQASRGDASPSQENANQEREGEFSQSPRGGFRGGRGGRGRGGRGRGGFRRPYNSNNNNNNAPRSPNPSRIESPNSLFVANLPYSYNDEDLKNLLPKATRATVAKNYQGKSKGFGFIEFANEEERQSAFALATGLKAQDRELIVKIALVNDRQSPASPSSTPPAVVATA